jgi:hypothetical protein
LVGLEWQGRALELSVFFMLGPGKYNEATTRAREETGAEGVILIVFKGKHGNGFSCQAPFDIQIRLPAILRDVAEGIERDFSL